MIEFHEKPFGLIAMVWFLGVEDATNRKDA